MTIVAEPKPEAWKKVEAAKRASTGQLLLKAARLMDERAVARVNAEKRRVQVRPAHTRLFPHIDVAGTRLTELARRVGVTKQAVGQLVDDLAQEGVVELAPDPTDGRARLVRFTPRGLEAIRQGLGVLAQVEDEIARKVGKQRMKDLHDTLALVVEALESLPREDESSDK